MILSFKTTINGKPTYFPQKILQGLYRLGIASGDTFKYAQEFPGEKLLFDSERNMKIHSIRTDEKNRWKAGIMIDFFINARQKDMFRFAPRIPVVSTQKIRIKYTTSSSNTPLIYIEIFGNSDFKCFDTYNPELKISSFKNIEKIALNDGFENLEDFFSYFNEDFEGKILHWTDLRY